MQPGRQQHAQSQHAKPAPLQLRCPTEAGTRRGTEIAVVAKPCRSSGKQTKTSGELAKLQRSAVAALLRFPASSTFQDVFPGLLLFECAAKSNITDYKTVQSLLLELPPLLSLFAPTCHSFSCPPTPSQSSSSLLLAPLCCATDCRGPTLLLLPDSPPPRALSPDHHLRQT